MRDCAIHVRQAVKFAVMLLVNAIYVTKTFQSQSVALAQRTLNLPKVNRVTFVNFFTEIKLPELIL